MKTKLINDAKKRGIDIEILENYHSGVSINTLNDKLELFQIDDIKKYIIKAIKEDKCVKISIEDIKDSEKILEDLEELFIMQDNKNKNMFSKGNIKSNIKRVKIDYNDVINDLKSLNDLKNTYPLIKSIEASYSYVYFEKSINNQVNDCELECSDYYNSFGVAITLCKDDVNKVLYLSYYEKDYDFLEFKNYLCKKIENTIIKLDSKSVKTGKYNIILTNKVVSNLLFTFSDAFQSKGIYLKTSVLTDKLNKKIFSDKISILEDSPNGLIKMVFDNEGNKKEYQQIVENGVFIKEINDTEYAIKLKKEPTGNAGGINNLYIKPDVNSFADLVEKLSNGIIIDEAFGMHSGIDKKSGNISLQAEGLLVEDGKITKGLGMIILSTNIFEVLSNVTLVGSDNSKENPEVITPSLLLHDITITGKE